jgi:hypothetical protein
MAAIGTLTGPMNFLFVFAVGAVIEGGGALVQLLRKQQTLPRAPYVAAAVLMLLFAIR